MARLTAHLLLLLSVLALSAMGASLPGPDDAPTKDPQKDSAASVTTHLGIKFSSSAQDTKETPASPARPDPLLPDSSLPLTILKPYVITTPRVKLTERDVLTDQAKLALAKKTQLTPLYQVTFGPLSQLGAYYFDWLSILGGWHPNDLEALVLYRQEEDVRRKNEMDSLMRLETIYDINDAKQLQRLQLGPSETKPQSFIVSPKNVPHR